MNQRAPTDYRFCRGLASEPSKAGRSTVVVPSEAVKKFFQTHIGNAISAATHKGFPVFQICIRENYINIYWNGCSVLRMRPADRGNEFTIHHKYMYVGSGSSRYISLELAEDGKDLLFRQENWSFYNGIIAPAMNGNIPAVVEHGGDEKENITRYLRDKKPILIDLEIAFARELDEEERKNKKHNLVADRIDMAVLVEHNGEPLLRLVEVKLSGDSRLRTSTEAQKPEIIRQMRHYKAFIEREYQAIVESYKAVARNYLELGMVRNLGGTTKEATEALMRRYIERNNDSSLDRRPYLLIIGNDKCLSANNKWKINHKQRLERELEILNLPCPEYFV